MNDTADDRAASRDFIRTMIAEDVAAGKHAGRVVTRFPPEPNGYLHIGHAKSICLNFGIAGEFDGARCHLRFDDTNPETEETRYVESIQADVRWLGFDWGEHLYFASDYFEDMYRFAEHLIREGNAYVDSATEERIREFRGTVMEPGHPTPDRDRPAGESLDLFRRMRAGEFPDGALVLRARIDLASPNMLMRDPVLYRIRHAHHYRTGDDWCIYPLYDYAHPIEDALECVTHSLCTLEFENNRELYDWVVANIPVECRPEQTEFARLALDYTVMSKRKLLQLVDGGHVSGWDDPRMPTLAGLRRRGVTPESIRAFSEMIGVARTNSRVDIGKLEYAVRDDLNHRAPRVMCVLRPLRIVLTNYPEGATETIDAPSFPRDVPLEGSRPVPFSRTLYIERDDFSEHPPRGFFRLAPGREVRLRYAYIIRCDDVVKNERGEIVELRCTYDPATAGGTAAPDRGVKGTLHWVSAEHSLPAEVRLYDRLFTVPDPDAGEGDVDFRSYLNPESLVVLARARIEPAVREDPPGTHYQFERQGYFCSDTADSRPDALVFNRTVTLRDTWAKRAPDAAPTEDYGRPRRVKPERHAEPAAQRGPDVLARSAALEQRLERYMTEMGLPREDAEILTRDEETAAFFEAACSDRATPRAVANWIINELPRERGDRALAELPFDGAGLGTLAGLVEQGVISSSAGREVLAEMARAGEKPMSIVERLGLRQVSDDTALEPLVDSVLAANAGKVAEYRAGRTGLLGFFVGQVMSRSGGRANPERVKALLADRLD